LLLLLFLPPWIQKKKSRRSLTKRKEPSLASGHIWSPHDVSFFYSLNSLLRCPSSLLW
jgi:hypothetical protein